MKVTCMEEEQLGVEETLRQGKYKREKKQKTEGIPVS